MQHWLCACFSEATRGECAALSGGHIPGHVERTSPASDIPYPAYWFQTNDDVVPASHSNSWQDTFMQ